MASPMKAGPTCIDPSRAITKKSDQYAGVFSIRIAVCFLEIHLPEPNSLKQKRAVLQSLIKRLRNRFNVSVTEVGAQDLWQRSELGVAAVCHNSSGAHRIGELVLSFVEEEGGVEVISSRMEIY